MIDAVGSVATALTVLFAWPQAMSAIRTRHTAGIHWGSTAITALSGFVWAWYGLGTHSHYIVISNVSVFAAALVTAYAQRHAWHKLAPSIGGGIAVAAGLGVAGGVVPVGLLGVCAGGLMAVPQAITALRAPRMEGVSVPTYALLAVLAACWLAYGIGIADPLVAAPNVINLPSSLIVLHRATRPAPP